MNAYLNQQSTQLNMKIHKIFKLLIAYILLTLNYYSFLITCYFTFFAYLPKSDPLIRHGMLFYVC